MPISQSRNLLRGRIITFEEALEEEQNILHQLDYPSRREEFLGEVIQQTSDIEATVAGHLGIDDVSVCRLSRTEEWMHGSFNLCIPVHINKWGGRVIIRFPLPYKTGELVLRGNSDEKLRCEVATYVWIQENCPEVPTPTLRGFGFTNGQRVWFSSYSISIVLTYLVQTIGSHLFLYSVNRALSTGIKIRGRLANPMCLCLRAHASPFV